ncbi:MAG: LysR family transcriptional regulator [Burkholderiaceae bacterium]
MELWQLRYFLSVAEAGSLSKASLQLNVAAPAVSRVIRATEGCSWWVRLGDWPKR